MSIKLLTYIVDDKSDFFVTLSSLTQLPLLHVIGMPYLPSNLIKLFDKKAILCGKQGKYDIAISTTKYYMPCKTLVHIMHFCVLIHMIGAGWPY